MIRLGCFVLCAALAAGAACRAADAGRPMPPAAASELTERLARDFAGRSDRPIAAVAKRPRRSSDGTWRSPDGKPVADAGIVGWTRPAQSDGSPFRAFFCESEKRYWVHQESALGSTDFWFGPFDFAR